MVIYELIVHVIIRLIPCYHFSKRCHHFFVDIECGDYIFTYMQITLQKMFREYHNNRRPIFIRIMKMKLSKV